MSAAEGNSEFYFPESLNVPRDEVEGNIESRGKTKLAISQRKKTLSALLYRNKHISQKDLFQYLFHIQNVLPCSYVNN